VLSDRRCRLGRTLILACSLVSLLPLTGLADGATAQDVVQAVHSFQQLATLDPVTAGEVWMESRAAKSWRDYAKRAADDVVEAQILFGHAIPFAHATEDGSPVAGLYNPWVGTLILFSYDERASIVEAFSIHEAERLGDQALKPEAFAVDAMAAVDAVSAQFDAFAGAGELPGRMSARDLENAVNAAIAILGTAYGMTDDPTIAQANVVVSIESLFAEELIPPIDLLEEMSDAWRSLLVPVWMAESAETTYVVLASPASPIDWLWLEIATEASAQPIRSASLLRLYDRILSRGGEDA